MPRKIQFSEPPPRLPVTLREIAPLGDEVYRLRFDNPGFLWEPGDCIAVYADGVSGVSRPYSLSGAVTDPLLEMWVRRFPGGAVSDRLCSRVPGDRIDITPPFGWFRPAEPVGADKIYFATGTGIAPFLSAIRSGASARIYWGMRRPLRMAEITACRFLSQSEAEGFRSGRITNMLTEISWTPETHIYACGLDRMIEEVAAYFTSRGLPGNQLHRECFFTAADA